MSTAYTVQTSETKLNVELKSGALSGTDGLKKCQLDASLAKVFTVDGVGNTLTEAALTSGGLSVSNGTKTLTVNVDGISSTGALSATVDLTTGSSAITQAPLNNSTKVSTTQYVDTAISAIPAPATPSLQAVINVNDDLQGATPTNNQVIKYNGTNVVWSDIPAPTIADGSITTAKLADSSVTTGKIANSNVTNAKLDKVNIPLSGFGSATADVSMGSKKITNLANPTSAQDGATKAYVDASIPSLTGYATLAGQNTFIGNTNTFQKSALFSDPGQANRTNTIKSTDMIVVDTGGTTTYGRANATFSQTTGTPRTTIFGSTGMTLSSNDTAFTETINANVLNGHITQSAIDNSTGLGDTVTHSSASSLYTSSATNQSGSIGIGGTVINSDTTSTTSGILTTLDGDKVEVKSKSTSNTLALRYLDLTIKNLANTISSVLNISSLVFTGLAGIVTYGLSGISANLNYAITTTGTGTLSLTSAGAMSMNSSGTTTVASTDNVSITTGTGKTITIGNPTTFNSLLGATTANLSGTSTAVTKTLGNNSQAIATTQYVDASIPNTSNFAILNAQNNFSNALPQLFTTGGVSANDIIASSLSGTQNIFTTKTGGSVNLGNALSTNTLNGTTTASLSTTSTAVTKTLGNNSTAIATTQYVDATFATPTLQAVINVNDDLQGATPTNNQVIKYNGTNVVWGDVGGGGSQSLQDVINVNDDLQGATPTNNQYIKYNGTNAVWSALPTNFAKTDAGNIFTSYEAQEFATGGISLNNIYASDLTGSQSIFTTKQGGSINFGSASATTTLYGAVNVGTGGTGDVFIGHASTNSTTINGSATIGSGSGTVNIGQTSVVTGATPRIANITSNHDAIATKKGCSLIVGNNNGTLGSPYKLFLAGDDPLHYIYSTGAFGDQMFFGEYGNWNFYSTSASAVRARINNSNGVYTALSDRNQKKDFEPSTLGLKEILQLKPTLYRIKNKTDQHEEQDKGELKCVGLIAQEVEPIIPQAYVKSDDFIGLDYNSITAVLIKAVQEIKQDYDTKLANIEARLLALENK